jgi:hypothetical protein
VLAMTVFPIHAQGQLESRLNIGPNAHVSVDNPKDGASESWLSADPTDPNRLLACTVIFPDGENRRYTTVYLSVDRGRTWRATLTTRTYAESTDPACALGPNGVANHIALVLKPASPIVIAAYRSTDGGATWRERTEVRNSGIDRESIVADATGGRYHGRVYITGMTFLSELDKPVSPRNGIGAWTSTDGGATFDKAAKSASPASRYTYGLGNSVVLKDGTLLTLFGENLNTDTLGLSARVAPGRADAIIEVAASTDGGETYVPAVKIADKYTGDVNSGAVSTPSLAADPGSPSFGPNVYAVWTDFRSGHAQILLSRSIDKGKSWSAPRVMNDVLPEARDVAGPNVFMPNVAVNREGAVLLTWYDRHDTPGNLGWRLRARSSLDGGDTWLPSVSVSSAMNTYHKRETLTVSGNVTGGGAREHWTRGGELRIRLRMHPAQFWAADYSGLAADAGGVFHALWTDNRTGVPQLWTAPIAVSGAVVRKGDRRD